MMERRKFDQKIGYRTRLVGDNRFVFVEFFIKMICRERPMCRSAYPWVKMIDLGGRRNPFEGFLLPPNLSHPPNFPEPDFIHGTFLISLYDAKQSSANDMLE